MAKKRSGVKRIAVDGRKVVAQNRRARHDYDILETVECGLVLIGSEVKSLRAGHCQLKDGYVRIDRGEAWLFGIHIPPYLFATGFGGHEPERPRKLLLHHREIEHLGARSKQESLTIVPLALYFLDGRAKVEVALAKGRKLYDKRRALAERDTKREAERAMRVRE